MSQKQRPLSPNVQIYRPQLTSVLSISHRLTGIALAVGSLLLVYWLIAAAAGPSLYLPLHDFLSSWIGLALLFCWIYALFYHLCNGIRHLFWDATLGFELTTIYASGWTVVGVSIVLTLAGWILSLLLVG